MAAMPSAPVNDIELTYETFGDDDGVPLLLIMGLGAQMVAWDVEFAEGLVDRGFFVIRYDNRDVGESTRIDSGDLPLAGVLMKAMAGDHTLAPYLLTDMADDAAGLLDHLGIDSAHVVGASMGGMIAQTLAIEHAERVRTLTSIMSTTGEPGVGAPDPEVMGVLMAAPPDDREGAIAHAVNVTKAISSPDHYDPERATARATRSYDRGPSPDGTVRQLLAIVSSPPRVEGLAALDVPTLVVHGEQDRLVGFSGGQRTAELIPGAQLLAIEDMAHDLPPAHWAAVIEAITTLAARSAS